jgi:glyoxylase-like metal-dependent hydrolase (beta-lactamase superfamily II)
MMVNYFFVRTEPGSRRWVLVDAGLRVSGPRLLREAARRFGPNNPPAAILLTHGHFDHVGALPWLTRRWQVPIYAHVDELPFLRREMRYPAPDPSVGGGLLALSAWMYPRTVAPISAPILPLPSDGTVPELPGWQWLPTPGHSPGQIALWREADRVLLSGDALITTRQESARAVFSQRLEIRPPPAYFTPDWRRAYSSLLRLRELAPRVVGSGHGLPAAGDFLQHGIDDLARNFFERGLPRHGRYVPTLWNPVPA